MSTSTTTFRRRPLTGLARAEFLQFTRNTTLVTMGILFPIGLSLATFFVAREKSSTVNPVPTLELFACMALLFVQYYSVLSMVTTRRGEGVLKRLRTGETPDWKIQLAPAVPGALLTLVGAVVVPVVVYAAGAPAPVNPVLMVLALLAGLALFTVFALATSGLTKNAEAAQITSLPVMVLAIVGLGSLRGVMPDALARVANWTPFAAVSDLVSLGAVGRFATTAADGRTWDLVGTFGRSGRPLVTLVAWTVVAVVLTRRCFRWDDRG